MNKIFIGIGCFVAGLIVGSIGSIQLTKKSIKQASQEEITKIRNLYFGDKENQNEKQEKEMSKVNRTSSTIDKFDAKTEAQYEKYSAQYSGDKKRRKTGTKPYVITEEEYINSENDQKGLYYFSDGVLADEDYNVIPNVEEIVGNANLMKFGENDNDPYVIYIRNEKYGIDYEVALQEQEFAEAAPKGTVRQHPVEDED